MTQRTEDMVDISSVRARVIGTRLASDPASRFARSLPDRLSREAALPALRMLIELAETTPNDRLPAGALTPADGATAPRGHAALVSEPVST